MARTYKDKPYKLQYPEYYGDYDKIWFKIPGTWKRLERKGVKPKKKRYVDKWHWVEGTPSWWTNIMMTKPKRRACRVWEHKTKFQQDLYWADCPDWGHKPHVYFW